jgi:hypothetical protein
VTASYKQNRRPSSDGKGLAGGRIFFLKKIALIMTYNSYVKKGSNKHPQIKNIRWWCYWDDALITNSST